MNEQQKKALNIAVRRFGKKKVLAYHKEHQITIDEWRCELRPLNTLSIKALKKEIL